MYHLVDLPECAIPAMIALLKSAYQKLSGLQG